MTATTVAVATTPEAYAAALAALPGMGPARLTAVLAACPPPDAWARILAGARWSDAAVVRALGPRGDEVRAAWRTAAGAIDVAAAPAALAAAGAGVALLGQPGYPEALAGDVQPPPVLFHQGRLALVSGPRVAIVGTRRCSPTGEGIAFELGRDLSAAGVKVVSGLAAGIDGAAHRGALRAAALAAAGGDASAAGGRPSGEPAEPGGQPASAAAPPIGVVGSGLDVVYPARHRGLWTEVARAGLLLSEAPLGARPERWRFPARNRIIAALADLVVVVESHRRGGSLHTVDEADLRAIDVMAVPGSVRNPAAAGTNELLAEGRAPVCSVDDVMVALGLGSAAAGGRAGPGPDRRPRPDPADQAVLEAIGWQPATLDHVVLRSGLDLARLAPALERLAAAGWVGCRGGWYEQIPHEQEEQTR
jgi:DNA processing protein